MLLLARTTDLDKVSKPTQGLSLFYTTLDRKYVEVREIEKMGRKAVAGSYTHSPTHET